MINLINLVPVIFGETLNTDWMPTGFIEKKTYLPDLFDNFWGNFGCRLDAHQNFEYIFLLR